jgi:hypothetical protein
MCEQVCGKPKPGLLDMPGVTPAQVASFYEAAAFFFQEAPWKEVGYEAAIRVECDKFQSGPWYAVLQDVTPEGLVRLPDGTGEGGDSVVRFCHLAERADESERLTDEPQRSAP